MGVLTCAHLRLSCLEPKTECFRIIVTTMLSVRALNMTRAVAQRNFGVMATPAMTKATDPIQALFVEKIQEYGSKKAASGGKMVDATPATEANLTAELDKVAKSYGGGAGVDMTAFPSLTFKDPSLDAINIS